MEPKLSYLACPYMHENETVIEERFQLITKIAAHLITKGILVISPITHNHPINKSGLIERCWETWKEFDTELIKRCDQMIVIKINGWKESTGVQAEIKIAEKLGKPIKYMENAWIPKNWKKLEIN